LGGGNVFTRELPLSNDTSRFRANLVRVLAVQIVALALLGLLQWHYSR
jgi:hypothetical protein